MPKYELEERTLKFAKKVRVFIRKISKDIANIEDGKQLIRSSGSVGANYIEANEALSKKDFQYRIKICKKEAKESSFWLELISVLGSTNLEEERIKLYQESVELVKIFSAIYNNSNKINESVF
ncbi:MAG: four helix bundle protein [Cyclobacteriaceae bacterium]